MKYPVCVLACLCVAALARAEVRETRENSFTIESTVTTSAAPAEVYRALGTVSEWWDPEHTWSGRRRTSACSCRPAAASASSSPMAGPSSTAA